MTDAHDDASTVAHPRLDLSGSPEAAFDLTVIEGPDLGAAFRIDGSLPPRVLLGQGPACAFRLTDRSVSRRHVALGIVGRRLRVTDLQSTNGTYVDGIGAHDVFLNGGEILRLGGSAVRVELATSDVACAVSTAARFGRVIGVSTEMRRLYPLCERLAQSDVPVIVEGETGTGKEVMAESLHEESPRREGPFVIFDCTAVPPGLVESELFGHERGAFTGAVGARKGVFEQAHGGTLFIDEIGDLELSLQPKLLRALERSEVRRVGGDRWLRVDVRVIAATRRDLDHEVQAGRFRDDLFHRLAVGRIELPPLRERRGDVTVLARHFAAQVADGADLPPALLRRWEDYRWTGNVRELRNAVARQLALGELVGVRRERRVADASDGDADFLDNVLGQELTFSEARRRMLDEFERRYVEHVLAKHAGNVSRAAAASGLARRYFQKIKARGATR